MRTEWQQLLKQAGYQVERVAIRQSQPPDHVWLRATKGEASFDSWIELEGTGSRLAFYE